MSLLATLSLSFVYNFSLLSLASSLEGEEEIKVHLRGKATHEKGPGLTVVERKSKAEIESTEDKKRLQIAAYIDGWNAFLKEIYKSKAKPVDGKDFLKVTNLSDKYKLDFEDFKNILGKYLRYRKLPVKQFNRNIDKFFEQKIKVKK